MCWCACSWVQSRSPPSQFGFCPRRAPPGSLRIPQNRARSRSSMVRAAPRRQPGRTAMQPAPGSARQQKSPGPPTSWPRRLVSGTTRHVQGETRPAAAPKRRQQCCERTLSDFIYHPSSLLENKNAERSAACYSTQRFSVPRSEWRPVNVPPPPLGVNLMATLYYHISRWFVKRPRGCQGMAHCVILEHSFQTMPQYSAT